MRRLTIKRRKSFVGCLGVDKVYVEDHESFDTLICGVKCRRLGALKNGREASFEIENGETRIFVTTDRLSKNFCNEFYRIPEGEDDVTLTGENKLNPVTGNCFRFDNNDTEETIVHRRKNAKKGVLALIIGWLIGVIIGCIIGYAAFFITSNMASKPKTFTEKGISITLTGNFQRMEYEGYDLIYSSANVDVFIFSEDFTLEEGSENYTKEEYAELIMESNSLGSLEIRNEESLTFFVYSDEGYDESYTYFTYVYKSDEAFWIVQFITLSEKAQVFEARISQWAKTVEFTN